MRTVVDLGKERGHMGMHIITTATTVDCGSREVGLRRSLRSMLDRIIPACCAAGFEPQPPNISQYYSSAAFSSDTDSPSSSSSSSPSPDEYKYTTTCTLQDNTTYHQHVPLKDSVYDKLILQNRSLLPSSTTIVKGTFFGQRNGRVSFCLQDDNQHRHTPSRRTTTTTFLSSSFSHPLLLLEFSVPTSYLAKEMQQGLLRITLVEENNTHRQQLPINGCSGIFEVPVWSMYCNGRKVGYATRRKMTAADSATLTRTQSVSAGAGVLPSDNDHGADGIMYLRASFQRIIGSPNSESFHMINPDHDGPLSSNNHGSGQELSIFLLR